MRFVIASILGSGVYFAIPPSDDPALELGKLLVVALGVGVLYALMCKDDEDDAGSKQ